MSEIKNGELEQFGAEPFEQQQFGTAGVEGVNESELKANVKSFSERVSAAKEEDRTPW